MTDPGSVDEVRLQPWVRDRARAIPLFAWVFILAAGLDAVLHLPWSWPARPLDVLQYATLPALSQGLLILLPAIALVRRPGVRDEAGLAFRGLVLIGAGTFLQSTLMPLALHSEGTDPWASSVAGGLASAVVVTLPLVAPLGWLGLATALRHLGSGPVPFRANLVAALVVVVLVAAPIVERLTFIRISGDTAVVFGSPSLIIGSSIGALVRGLAMAWLAWTCIRASSITRGPAIGLAAASLGALAIGSGMTALLAVVHDLGARPGGDLAQVVGAVAAILTIVSVVPLSFAIALGLLDRGRTAARSG